MKYAITGATGGFGAFAIEHLISLGVSPSSIVAVVRDPKKAQNLAAKSIEIRQADYNDEAALTTALKGIDRLLLVSSSEVGQRAKQHANAIRAAKKSGVKQIVYTSLAQASISKNPLAPEHKATEEALAESGIDTVILRNNWYFENYLPDLDGAKHSGSIAAAVKTGKVGAALKTEYAEAAARVLIGQGHSGRVYELCGALWSYDELAQAATQVLGRPVALTYVTEEQKKATLISYGVPEGVAGFYAALDTSIEAGTLAFASNDLEKLLGRKPMPIVEALKTLTGARVSV